METRLFTPEEAVEAGCLLSQGALVVFPTETVYGLGADVFNEEACARIFSAKGRPQDNPLITHIFDTAQLDGLVLSLPPLAERLMDAFWPGPLTLVLEKNRRVSDIVSAGLDTVGVRMPRHRVAQAFLKAANTPVAAPSANRSGKPSPTSFAMACNAMEGRVEGILDGGPCENGLESTVIAWTGSRWAILRPGSVTRTELFSILGDNLEGSDATPHGELEKRSPGTRHPHYKPSIPVRMICSKEDLNKAYQEPYSTWALIDIKEDSNDHERGKARSGPVRLYADWQEEARNLYSDFHELDVSGVPGILVRLPPAGGGIEEALRNRILKASEGCI